MRRRCIRPLVVKAIGGLSSTPSDTGVMPQKIHPNSGIGDAREPLKPMGFEVAQTRSSTLAHWRRTVLYISSV